MVTERRQWQQRWKARRVVKTLMRRIKAVEDQKPNKIDFKKPSPKKP
jgi:hypothetical protein